MTAALVNVPVGVFAAFVAAIISALGAYFVAARRLSGRIETSEADSLWKESASIREDYRERLAAADVRQAKLEERVANLEARNARLAEENVQLMRDQLELSRVCAELRDERDRLQQEIDNLKTMQGGRRAGDDEPRR